MVSDALQGCGSTFLPFRYLRASYGALDTGCGGCDTELGGWQALLCCSPAPLPCVQFLALLAGTAQLPFR